MSRRFVTPKTSNCVPGILVHDIRMQLSLKLLERILQHGPNHQLFLKENYAMGKLQSVPCSGFFWAESVNNCQQFSFLMVFSFVVASINILADNIPINRTRFQKILPFCSLPEFLVRFPSRSRISGTVSSFYVSGWPKAVCSRLNSFNFAISVQILGLFFCTKKLGCSSP